MEGVKVDFVKISTVINQQPLRNLKGIQAFLGFCNFYYKFIPAFSWLALPLTRLIKKDAPFVQSLEYAEAFTLLKRALIVTPLLYYFKYEWEIKVETDASDSVLAGVLLQKQGDDWYLVAYYFKNIQGAEYNYNVQDKEMLTVVRAIMCQQLELVGLYGTPFLIITDY